MRKRVFIFHYPGQYSVNMNFTPQSTVANIILELTKDENIPKKVRRSLSLDGFLHRFYVYIDGARLYDELDNATPQNCLLVFASNKIAFNPYIYHKNPEVTLPDVVDCASCGESRPIIYRHRNQCLCAECYTSEFRRKAFEQLADGTFADDDNIDFLISGERDSTVAATLLLDYLRERNFDTRISFHFFNNGNNDELCYRDNCQKAVLAFGKKHSVDIKIWDADRYEEILGFRFDDIKRLIQGNLEEVMPCNVCSETSSLPTITRLFSEVRSSFTIFGHTLSDLFRLTSQKHVPGIYSARAPDSKYTPPPMQYATDQEVGIYAALENIDFFVGDCPYADSSPLYRTGNTLQQIQQLAPDLMERELEQILDFGSQNLDSRLGAFLNLQGYLSPNAPVDNLSLAKLSVLLHGSRGMGHFVCHKCESIVRYNSIEAVLRDQHKCKELPEGNLKRFRKMVASNTSHHIGDDFGTEASPSLSNERFALKENISVFWGENEILLRDHSLNRFFSIDGRREWQRMIVERLWNEPTNVAELTRLVSVLGKPTEGDIRKYLWLLWEQKLITDCAFDEERRSSTGDRLSKCLGQWLIFDEEGILPNMQSTASILGKDWKVASGPHHMDSIEDYLGEFEAVAYISNSTKSHQRVASLAWKEKKAVLHCSAIGDQVVLGPLTYQKTRGCYGCFHEKMVQNGDIPIGPDLAARRMNSSVAGYILASLIRMQVEQIRGVKHIIHNNIKCYALRESVAQPFLVRPASSCPICHGWDPFANCWMRSESIS